MANTHVPLAHIDKDGRLHLLVDHLRGVEQLARKLGARFGAAECGGLAGRWHDLGKFSGDFQTMIHGVYGLEAHIEAEGGPRDHSTAGALLARERIGDDVGWALAWCIAGHHAGLSDEADLNDRLRRKRELLDRVLEKEPPSEILQAAPSALELPTWTDRGTEADDALAFEFFVRLLFSALCDADFLDTETFHDGDSESARGGFASLSDLRMTLDVYLDKKAKAGAGAVHDVRQDVRRACTTAAELRPGAFSLTVPTGGGKTLASMAFALRHAELHGLDRVIVAIPFTSIIEQTADEYRRVFGAENVVEHHSAIDSAKETPRNRLASENWDAPIVVTTTVQLFESLFANRTSKARKLHSLVRSVLVLDEAQVVVPKLLPPIVDMVSSLVRDLGTTLVISTATQPAWTRDILPRGMRWFLENVREICPASLDLPRRIQRVCPTFMGEASVPYSALAQFVAQHPSSLSIVHRRADARVLCEHLDQIAGDTEALHLTALMAPAHRSAVLGNLKKRLKSGHPVRCVATQLVEAGVDIDFPVVFRAMAGIDALAQAAGRCNREGRLSGLGQLFIFTAETEPPPGVLRTALSVTKVMRSAAMAAGRELDLFSPQTHADFFRRLYANVSMEGGQNIQELRTERKFGEVAQAFRLIESGMVPVVIALRVHGEAPLTEPVPGNTAACAAVDEIVRHGVSRTRMRALQRFTVNLPRRVVESAAALRLVDDTIHVLENPMAYDARFGLLPERLSNFEPEDFIV
ncbi:MAG: CRISPR-associated endonuclease Cas3'' [Acidobacteria bacterium]|nr:CRISPR-associated endonuclease Cas3'' [Acidobacteriota bacterium]